MPVVKNRKTLKTIILLWFGSLSGAGFAFLTQIILARWLGISEFGAFSSVMATVSLVSPFAAFGVAQLWLKVFGLEGTQAIRWLKSCIKFTVISSLLVFFSLNVWGMVGDHDEITRQLICILSMFVFSQMLLELISSRFQLEGKYFNLAIWQFLPHFFRFFLILSSAFFLPTIFDVVFVGYIYAIVSVIMIFFGSIYLFSMFKGKISLAEHSELISKNYLFLEQPKLCEVIKESWPFGIAAFSYFVYYQSNIILVKYIIGDEAAGYYNVAFTIISAIYLLPNVIYQRFLLPKFHVWANHDASRFFSVYQYGIRLMLIIGLLFMILLWFFSSIIIPYIFGEKYNSAVEIINILALAIPCFFLASNAGAVLVTRDNMRLKVKYMMFVAVLNFCMNIFLIHTYAEYGAAISTVISNFVLMLLYIYGVKKYVFSGLKEGNYAR